MNDDVKKILIIDIVCAILFVVLGLFLNSILYILGIVCLVLINFVLVFKIYKKLENVDKCLNKIIAEEDANIIELEEICNLKNDLNKTYDKIKEKNSLIKNEKKYLEETLKDIEEQLSISLKSMTEINDALELKQKEDKLLNNKKQIEKVKCMISGLLKLSKLDAGTIKLKYEKIKVSSLISKSIEPLKEIINDRKIKIDLNIRNTDVFVDLSMMSEAIRNIIKNAIEYTNDEILIESNTLADYTEIIITNNGEAINKEDLPHIFKRFYKGNSKSDNVGIGLSISKKIIEMQNGKIEVRDLDRTSFVIKIYK